MVANDTNEQLFDQMLKNIFDSDSGDDNSAEDDKTFRKNTKNQITKRDKDYSDLLSHFVHVTKIRNFLKEIFKWLFFLMIIGSIIVLTVIVFLIFKKYIESNDMEYLTDGVPLLITSMVGFISTIITIPVTITKYLFSTKEDENITKIILHTQDHDVIGRDWATNLKKVFDESHTNKERGPTADSA